MAPLLATAASNDSVESSAEISNEPPTNLQIEIQGDSDEAAPGVQIAPDASGTTTISLTGRAEDGNGWKDIEKGTIEVVAPDGSSVEIAEGSPEPQGNGRKRACTFHFALDSASPPGDYTVKLTISDKQQAQRTAETTFTFEEYLALALESGAVSFGSGLGPGQTTHADPASLGVKNLGNVPLDLSVSASPLTRVGGDGTIDPGRLRYSTSASMDPEFPLSTSGYLDASFDLAPGSTRLAYLDVHMPTGDEQYVPPGRYIGTITFGGAAG